MSLPHMGRVRTQAVAILPVIHRFIPVVTKQYRCIGRHLLSQALPIAKHQKYSPRHLSSVLRSPREVSLTIPFISKNHGAVALLKTQTNVPHHRQSISAATRPRHLSATHTTSPSPLYRPQKRRRLSRHTVPLPSFLSYRTFVRLYLL